MRDARWPKAVAKELAIAGAAEIPASPILVPIPWRIPSEMLLSDLLSLSDRNTAANRAIRCLRGKGE